MAKKVLYLSYDGITDALGQSQILPYLLGLEKLGHSFHIVSFEKKGIYHQFQSTIEQQIEGLNIVWHPLFYTKKPPVLSTLFDLNRMRNKALRLLVLFQFDVVHCRSYLPALVALKLKNKNNFFFLFDMRGFWVDERVEGKLWNLKHPVFLLIYHYMKRQESRLLKEANAIVSLTHSGKLALDELYPLIAPSKKTTVIPCCVDQMLFTNRTAKKSLLELVGIDKNKIVLAYIGSIGTWYMLDEMLDFFKIQQSKEANLHFLFLSKDSKDTILQKAREKQILTTDISVLSVPYREMPDYLSVIDYGIFFIRPSFSKRASSPIKQAELMAMGIPIICNAGVGDSEAIVREHAAGFVFDELSDEAFDNFSFQQLHFDRERALRAVSSIFSLENGVQAYDTIYTFRNA